MLKVVQNRIVIITVIKKYKAYKKFLAVTKETSANEIIFSIEKLIDNSNITETIFYKTDSELKEFDNKKNWK